MIEHQILSSMLTDESYTRKVMPFIKDEYFADRSHKLLLSIVQQYFIKYNTVPDKAAMLIEIDSVAGVDATSVEDSINWIKNYSPDPVNIEWLLDQTEKFCQDKAIYNAIMSSITILEKEDGQKGNIPTLLQQALQVSFDTSVGHDFIDDAESRFDYYHNQEVQTPFDLDMMNKITKGGIPNKTLNIILAGTGVGKSLFMCHMAASHIMIGKNVLYITMEMAEERIAERIDANLLDVTLDDLSSLTKEMYDKKMNRLKEKVTGKLIVKEYPTASANANHFRHLIQELRTKKNFKPDVIFIDYLNICSSFRIKGGSNAGSYTIVKSIAEELRGLAVEHNVPIISATQATRSGAASSDLSLEDTSESFGLPATADFMVGISQTEELESLNQMLVKQLKNRYSDPSKHRRFVVGIDKAKMRLYDVEQSAQGDLVDDVPIVNKILGWNGSTDIKDVFSKFK